MPPFFKYHPASLRPLEMFCDEPVICDTSITGKNRLVYLYHDLEK